MKRLVLVPIAAVLCCLASSCSGPQARVDNRVRGLKVVDIRSRNSGGFTEVEVDVQNRRPGRLDIEYRFEWRDDDNFTVRDARTQWTPLVLKGGETKALESTAPAPEATRPRLITRPSDPHRAPRI